MAPALSRNLLLMFLCVGTSRSPHLFPNETLDSADSALGDHHAAQYWRLSKLFPQHQVFDRLSAHAQSARGLVNRNQLSRGRLLDDLFRAGTFRAGTHNVSSRNECTL